MIEDSNKRQFYNLAQVKKTVDGSDCVIRSAVVRTNNGAYRRPVVKLATVLPGKCVLVMENRAGDVLTELIKSTTKLKIASVPFQAVK